MKPIDKSFAVVEIEGNMFFETDLKIMGYFNTRKEALNWIFESESSSKKNYTIQEIYTKEGK